MTTLTFDTNNPALLTTIADPLGVPLPVHFIMAADVEKDDLLFGYEQRQGQPVTEQIGGSH